MTKEERDYLAEWTEKIRRDAKALADCIRASDSTKGKASDLGCSLEMAAIDLRREIESWDTDDA